ncbi:hypothetical protein A3H75_00980 [Candidatus Uhrbacteria bacterium RIFCSPLOWO2_02_FULL_51_9]|uniref:Uncharacterized protein n=1 Tax=Candidatus Uhrbacteria bacterium RIFCSPLOWO2_02_FULL_51_9 TaxID=1802410 RepID=A0A1F7VEA9_9BACT|nr:MAG: hypothetical protein A3H75_00980 [Candidatus Uhrbacteria bacterium RIFCSPLOWO2_02_FULL_51_9]
MFSISLSFLVLLYVIFVVLTLVFAVINIYHLVSTGMLTLLSFSVSGLVVLLMFALIATTGIYVGTLDTTQTFTLFNSVSVPVGF